MRSLLKFSVFIGCLIAIIYGVNKTVPAQHLPWRPLNPAAPLGMATKTQLLSLSLSPSKRCMDMADALKPLASGGAEPHRPSGDKANASCGWDVARNVVSSEGINFEPDAVNMQCPLSIASYLWTREINRIAIEEFDQPISTITHLGTYACRRQNGNKSGQ